MIITRGFNSNTIITRGYGLGSFVEYIKAGCIFTKKVMLRLFNRDKQRTMFKKGC